jgi:hypothetical protein
MLLIQLDIKMSAEFFNADTGVQLKGYGVLSSACVNGYNVSAKVLSLLFFDERYIISFWFVAIFIFIPYH